MTNPHRSAASAGRLPSIRRALLLLGIACTAPTIFVAAGAAYEDFLLRKERVYEAALASARSLAGELERELRGVETGLRILATEDELERGALPAFHRRLGDALRLQNVDGYMLLDPKGVPLADSGMPNPGPAIRSALSDAALAKMGRSRDIVMAGLFSTALHNEPMLAIGIPVEIRGEVRYGLYAQIRPQRIGQALRRQAMPDGWVAAALDDDGLIVGRTREESRYVGQHAVPSLAAAAAREREGTLRSETKEGIPVLTAFSRSRDGRWTVAVGAPLSALTADLWRSLIWGACAGLTIIAAGIWAAYRLATRIEHAVAALVPPAIALGRGEAIDVPESRYSETAMLGRSLLHASRMLSQARRQAYHDPLTSLSNRLLFCELAARALAAGERSARPAALLALDLDHFKAVNDTQGHSSGDLVLKIAAERMSAALRATDIVARFGGDEFVVLLDGADADTARDVARKLNQALAEPYPGILASVTASIGIACFPRDGRHLEALLAQADGALYAAKAAGRNRYEMASSSSATNPTPGARAVREPAALS
ncbi:GGDEF domain-containing protein [Achromobacter sp. Marseille-Q0513]|uniref:sensor domain-containing diguanylate cyclase n=1 Tax=Achromobacter sp. Marseille-Q0513 TaxID=2829161 RepID=UPI001B8DD730|nr:sensor domain-containing diguanylate cyclase [Achromobacter sp. Marseille-Q0513]MBR8657389.1 GGDEF domain-containing protein [Achromobacter sp. Marseille-Q0513]